jgi:hypothetical protein
VNNFSCRTSGRFGTRAGTVLIVVAGISALLMSVTLVYLVNMRSDLEESELVVREAQARLVLIAGLQYIQEASRLGWDRPGTPEHEEGYGWTDVRDGSAGPKDRSGVPLYAVGSGKFPDIGGQAARFPLYAMERPPYAISTTFAYNPAPMNPVLAWRELVNYTKPDPQPAGETWEDFENGRPVPRLESANKSWFRVYRDRNSGTTLVEPATFTLTCGAGATQGFRTYAEAVADGKGDLFNNDPKYFTLLRSQERMLWFRTEWTSAVGGSAMGVRLRNGYWELPEINKDAHRTVYNSTPLTGVDQHWWVNRSPVGSFLWIQRLEHEPDDW